MALILQELLSEGEEIGAEEEDAWYLRRLDGGLFTLQNVDYILAWVSMEDDGVSGIPCSIRMMSHILGIRSEHILCRCSIVNRNR